MIGHKNQAGGFCCPHHGNTCGLHESHDTKESYNEGEIRRKRRKFCICEIRTYPDLPPGWTEIKAQESLHKCINGHEWLPANHNGQWKTCPICEHPTIGPQGQEVM